MNIDIKIRTAIEKRLGGLNNCEDIVLYAIHGLEDYDSKRIFLEYMKRNREAKRKDIIVAILSIRYEKGFIGRGDE